MEGVHHKDTTVPLQEVGVVLHSMDTMVAILDTAMLIKVDMTAGSNHQGHQ